VKSKSKVVGLGNESNKVTLFKYHLFIKSMVKSTKTNGIVVILILT